MPKACGLFAGTSVPFPEVHSSPSGYKDVHGMRSDIRNPDLTEGQPVSSGNIRVVTPSPPGLSQLGNFHPPLFKPFVTEQEWDHYAYPPSKVKSSVGPSKKGKEAFSADTSRHLTYLISMSIDLVNLS